MKLNLIWVLLLVSLNLSAQNTPQGWKDKGNDSLLRENYLQALEDFRSALKLNPNYLDAHEGLVQAFFSLGEFDEAGRAIGEAVRLGSGQTRIKVLQGRVLLGQGQLEEGLKLFQDVLSREPKNLGAFFGRAEYFVLKGKYLQAQKDYHEVLKADIGNLRAHLALIIMNLHQGTFSPVPSLLENILRNHSTDPLTHWWASQYYYKNGNLNRAQESLDNYLRLKKSGLIPPARGELNKGLIFKTVLLLSQNKPGEAVEVVTQIVSITPQLAYGWYLKGLAEFEDGRTAEALSSLERCLGLEKDNEMARIALENLLINQDSLEEYKLKKAALAEYHFTLGREALSSSRLTLAYDECRRGLLINPDSLLGIRKLAEIFKIQGLMTSYRDALVRIEDRYGLQDLDTSFRDEIEIQRSLYPDSFPDRWNIKINDFEKAAPRKINLGIYYLPASSQLDYFSGVKHLADFFQNEMGQNRNFEFLDAQFKNIKPSPVENQSTAFRMARENNQEFYILLEFREGFRDLTAVAQVYLGKSGRLLQTFPIYKKGLQRVATALRDLSKSVGNYFPLWGRLLQRNKNIGLVSIGTRDGVKKELKFTILKSGTSTFSGDDGFIKFSLADSLGTFTVTDLDDRLAEGTLEKTGFYDLITPGDEVLFVPTPKEPTPVVWPAYSELQRNILGLR